MFLDVFLIVSGVRYKVSGESSTISVTAPEAGSLLSPEIVTRLAYLCTIHEYRCYQLNTLICKATRCRADTVTLVSATIVLPHSEDPTAVATPQNSIGLIININ